MKRSNDRFGCYLLAALPAFAFIEAGALAQDSEAESTGSTENSNVIVVTADRSGVAKSVQDVPIAISVFGSEDLDRAHVERIEDLQFSTVGLTSSTFNGNTQIYIRGVGTNSIGLGGDNSVATYVDGVYVSRMSAANQEFMDLERVEVLKGPQAILYGRNATGGAINIVTADPTDTLSVKADARIGNYGATRFRASVSGPLGSDNVRARISAVRSQNDGYSENLLAGGDDFNSTDNFGVRGTLQLLPMDQLEITARLNYFEADGSGAALARIDPTAIYFVTGGQYDPDPRKAYHDVEDNMPIEDLSASLTAVWSGDNVTLTSISAYNRHETGPTFQDLDDSDSPAVINSEFNAGTLSKSETWSQEILLSSAQPDEIAGSIEWLIGGSIHKEEAEQSPRFGVFVGLPFTYPFRSEAGLDTTAYALFGELSYNFSEKFRVTGGIRYTDEEKDMFSTSLADGIFSFTDFTTTNVRSWDNVSFKLGAQYFVNEDVMLFAGYEEGFKSGGFNLQNVSNDFDQEEISSYQFGIKSEFLDGRLRWNTTAYYYDYTDIQLRSVRSAAGTGVDELFFSNGGKATVKGIETELFASPTDRIDLGLNLGYSRARFGDGVSLVNTRLIPPPPPGPPMPTNLDLYRVDVSGNPLPKAPKWTASAFGQFVLVESDAGSLTASGEYYWQSKMNHDPFETAEFISESYGALNANLTFESDDGEWAVSLYGRNLTDKDIIVSIDGDKIPERAHVLAPPRTYGVEVRFEF